MSGGRSGSGGGGHGGGISNYQIMGASNQQPPQAGGGPESGAPPAAGPSSGGGGSSSSSSRYESQKRRDWNTFGQYLRNHRPPLSLPRCSGAHVLEFLRYLDQFGKTKVHTPGCPFYGHPNPAGSCGCPLRQAWGSLDALIGRLRAAYEEFGGGTPEANPFGARAVRLYLREVRETQAKARGIGYEKKKRKKPGSSSAGAAAAAASAATTLSPSPATTPTSTGSGQIHLSSASSQAQQQHQQHSSQVQGSAHALSPLHNASSNIGPPPSSLFQLGSGTGSSHVHSSYSDHAAAVHHLGIGGSASHGVLGGGGGGGGSFLSSSANSQPPPPLNLQHFMQQQQPNSQPPVNVGPINPFNHNQLMNNLMNNPSFNPHSPSNFHQHN